MYGVWGEMGRRKERKKCMAIEEDMILANIYFTSTIHFWSCKGSEFDAITNNVKIKEGFPAGIVNAYVTIEGISSITDSMPLIICFGLLLLVCCFIYFSEGCKPIT
jgi:hypothetical protein